MNHAENYWFGYHTCSGVIISAIAWWLGKWCPPLRNFWVALLIGLTCTFGWEKYEEGIEKGTFPGPKFLSQREADDHRWGYDPLCTMSGFMFYWLACRLWRNFNKHWGWPNTENGRMWFHMSWGSLVRWPALLYMFSLLYFSMSASGDDQVLYVWLFG
ncbi:hypothetical protein CL634_08975 [bacterium]|nr:hypothetical protein [bacterium]